MKRKITLSYPHKCESMINHPDEWRVESVTNSVEFPPGQQLRRTDVEYLCNHPSWTVLIVPARKTGGG